MKKFEEKVADWHYAKYGTPCTQRVDKAILKAMEELGEVGRAYLKDDYVNLAEEIADVVIALTSVMGAIGTTLRKQVKRKLKILHERLDKSREAAA